MFIWNWIVIALGRLLFLLLILFCVILIYSTIEVLKKRGKK